MKTGIRVFFILGLIVFFGQFVLAVECGNGIEEGIEECDTGEDRSDTVSDACRTDCSEAGCGDGVVDSGEGCDDGVDNSDELPGACRSDCRSAWCGDGILDLSEGEECDDGNNDDSDGCSNECIKCYVPKDDLVLVENSKLCYGVYDIDDQGDEGVIIVESGGYDDNIVIDCDGAKIYSDATDSFALGEEDVGVIGQAWGFITNFFGGNSFVALVSAAGAASDAITMRMGTGILIDRSGVTLIDCEVEGYRNGIKISYDNNLLAGNKLCGNTKGIDNEGSGSFGAGNVCDMAVGWSENGVANSCTFDCDMELNVFGGEGECPECVCEEGTSEECDDAEVEEEEKEEEVGEKEQKKFVEKVEVKEMKKVVEEGEKEEEKRESVPLVKNVTPIVPITPVVKKNPILVKPVLKSKY